MGNNIFKMAVEATPNLEYHTGKNALSSQYSRLVIIRQCDGSVDIDKCLSATEHNNCRWDYAIGHNGKAYFVEIHPAQKSGNIDEMIAKAQWLAKWLNSAPELKAIQHPVRYWIATNGTNLRNPNKERKLASLNVKMPPVKILEIK